MKKTAIAAALVVLAGVIAAVYLFFNPAAQLELAMKYELGAAGLESKFVDVGDERIHYLEGGTGPAVLLVHGYAADSSNWVRFAKYLTGKYHVVAPDLPGFGESSKSFEKSYDIASQVGRLRAFSAQVVPGKHHIAGNSMGGHIAGVYSASFTDSVLSLGLFNSAGVTEPVQSELDKLLDQGINPLLADNAEQYDKVLDFVFVEKPMIPAAVKQLLVERSRDNRKLNEKILDEIHGPGSNLFETMLGRVKAPTFILWGDTDRLIDVSVVPKIQAGIAGSQAVIMENCGHAPMIERPEEAAGYYLEFLAGISE